MSKGSLFQGDSKINPAKAQSPRPSKTSSTSKSPTNWRKLFMKKEVSNMLSKASQLYADQTAIRALINIIPYIGGSLDVIFVSKGQKIVDQRLREFIKKLTEELNKVSESKVDKKYLDSEEWFDVVIKAMDSARKTRDTEKISWYAKILRGAVALGDRIDFDPEAYLQVLTELSSNELRVAKVIFEMQKEGPKDGEDELFWAHNKGWRELPQKCYFISKDDLAFILLRLQKAGFIREITGGRLDYQGGTYVMTPTFRKLMRYINEE